MSVAADGSGDTLVLAQGNDFYSAPRLSPGTQYTCFTGTTVRILTQKALLDGHTLAYITWNHPNMPWDVTQLEVVQLSDNGAAVLSLLALLVQKYYKSTNSDAEGEQLEAPVSILGVAAEASVLQPAWSPAGELHFVSDASNGFWNIHALGFVVL